MGAIVALKNAWRKNEAEFRGLFNGALPTFVTAPKTRDTLDGVPVFGFHLAESEQLEADLAFLARNGYRTLAGQEFIEHLRGEREIPERSVLLTFDDGPRNFFDISFPLLSRYQARAIAFIAPGLHANEANDPDAEARPMSWEEIRRIHDSGLVEFQSHTLESRFVPRWPQPAALAGCRPDIEEKRRGEPLLLRDDLARSRSVIEARLPGRKVCQLAFPMYLGTPAAIEDARAVGIEACYWGLRAGRPLNRRGDSPYYISRMSDEFLGRLPGSGRMSLTQLARNRLHRMRSAREWRRRYAR